MTGTLGRLTEYEAFLLRSVRKSPELKAFVNAYLPLQH
jgi:hypothetical protein